VVVLGVPGWKLKAGLGASTVVVVNAVAVPELDGVDEVRPPNKLAPPAGFDPPKSPPLAGPEVVGVVLKSPPLAGVDAAGCVPKSPLLEEVEGG
jgi:hypothetical protein